MIAAEDPHHERRWLILAVIGIAQLMVVLDITIVNVALPSAQHDLGFSVADRQWVITAYALAFGSLLLLGGRLGDLFGRKWAFAGGLVGFAAASAVGGAATSFGMLVAARAVQGAFGALLAPAALALVSTTFTDPAERGKAFGLFGAIAGAGSAAGLLLGGALTQVISWRWCLYINLAFAVPAALAAVRLLTNRGQQDRVSLDLPGTVSASAGLFCLVYGFSSAETASWTDPITIAALAASAVLLAAFLAIEGRVAHPLLPLRVLRERTRGGSYLALGLSSMGLSATFLFLTYYLQQIKAYSPFETGLAFLPLTGAIIVTATAANIVLLARVGPRRLITLGMALGAAAMAWLAQLTPSASYPGHVLPALVVMGVGMGNVIAPAFASGTYGVDPRDTGVASGVVNAAEQLGNSIGPAALSAVFASTLSAYTRGKPHTAQVAHAAAVHGDTIAFWVAAGILALGGALTATMMPNIKLAPQDASGEVERARQTSNPRGLHAISHRNLSRKSRRMNMTTKNVLLLGRTGVDIDNVHQQLGMPDLQLFGGTGLDDARSALAQASIDHVIMDSGIELETPLAIVREIFSLSDTTTVHIKDRATAKEGFVPFVRSVLRGLEDYEIKEETR